MSWAVEPLPGLTSVVTAIAVGLVLSRLAPVPSRLRPRVRPYVEPSLRAVTGREREGAVGAVFGPMVDDVADRLAGLLDRTGSEVTLLKLRQAGWYRELPEESAVAAYRLLQLRTMAVAVFGSALLGQMVGGRLGSRLALVVLGVVIGATRTRGRLERAINGRREVMRVEVYTVNQLLAMRVRAGGGVLQAVRATVERGHGHVISELGDALRLHRSGWAGADAFRRLAEVTPEPYCARTYRLLASAEERGADLAGALLAMSEDVRESRREAIKRVATKRRAAMLVPTIAILAPVLILFVAAPLPYLITGWQ